MNYMTIFQIEVRPVNTEQTCACERDVSPCCSGENFPLYEDEGDVDDLIFLNEPVKRHSER